MAILNYTTKIDAFKTISEIQSMLVKRGVKSIIVDYDDTGIPVGLTFFLYINDSPINFKLPSNYPGVLRVMIKDKKIPKSALTKEQATRVSWRILKDWIEAQMALIDAQIAKLEQVFLPYAVTDTGETLFDRMQNSNMIENITSPKLLQ
jgi:hypothetical protein